MPSFQTFWARLRSCFPFRPAYDTKPTTVTVTHNEKTGLFHSYGYDPRMVMDQLSNPKLYRAMAPMASPEKSEIESVDSDPESFDLHSEKKDCEDFGNENRIQNSAP